MSDTSDTFNTEQLTLEEYKRFFDEIPTALIRTDIETGKILMANEAALKMLGFSSIEELNEYSSKDFYQCSEDRSQLIEKIKKAGVLDNYQLKLSLPNKTLWVSCKFRLNCDGKCIEGSIRDVTGMMEIGQQQAQMGKMIDQKIASFD